MLNVYLLWCSTLGSDGESTTLVKIQSVYGRFGEFPELY